MSSNSGPCEERSDIFWRRAGMVAGAIIFLVFALQVFSPLRINIDVLDLLDLASRLTDHKPFLINGVRAQFPIGMPMFFSLMERMGIGRSGWFIAVNVFCLLVSAWASVLIFRLAEIPARMSTIAIVLAFTSFVLLKHVGMALTDIPYMALSLAAVAALEWASRRNKTQKLAWFAAAVLLTIAAIAVRRIGIALVPACLFIYRPSREMLRRSFSSIIFAASLIVVAIAILLLRRYVLYMPDFRTPFAGRSLAGAVKMLIYDRCLDLGEIALNLPYAKLNRAHPVVPLAGAFALVVLAVGFWRARGKFHVAHVYLLAYLAIMFVWPYGDNRFWLPVLPLLALVAVQAIGPLVTVRGVRWVLAVYMTAYLALYLIAAVYTTRITFSRNFPMDYADGQRMQDYIAAWSNGPVETRGARIIRRYGMR